MTDARGCSELTSKPAKSELISFHVTSHQVPAVSALDSKLSVSLRRATHDAHKTLEAMPFSQRLFEGAVDRELYVRYLKIMLRFHSIVESAVDRAANPVVRAVWREDMRRSVDLQSDLLYFERLSSGIEPEDLHAEAGFQAVSLQESMGLIGWVYVAEGSRLGGMVLGKRLRAKHPEWSPGGLTYFACSPSSVTQNWGLFRMRLDTLTLTPDETEDAVQGAIDGFQVIGRAFSGL